MTASDLFTDSDTRWLLLTAAEAGELRHDVDGWWHITNRGGTVLPDAGETAAELLATGLVEVPAGGQRVRLTEAGRTALGRADR